MPRPRKKKTGTKETKPLKLTEKQKEIARYLLEDTIKDIVHTSIDTELSVMNLELQSLQTAVTELISDVSRQNQKILGIQNTKGFYSKFLDAAKNIKRFVSGKWRFQEDDIPEDTLCSLCVNRASGDYTSLCKIYDIKIKSLLPLGKKVFESNTPFVGEQIVRKSFCNAFHRDTKTQTNPEVK